jgi:hypothetical protein
MATKEKKQRAKADIPEGETKEQRFIRVATPRVKQAISRLRLVKQTITSNNYSMTDEQVTKITEMLGAEVLAISNAFNGRNKSTQKDDIKVEL